MENSTPWMTRIPEILEDLGEMPKSLDRQTVQELLGVSPRRAQQLMAAAGARQEGRVFVMEKTNLILYLRAKGGAGLVKAEADRKRRLAAIIDQMRRDALRKVPPREPFVVNVSEQRMAEVKRRNLDALKGVELGPGYIVVRFDAPSEALLRLYELAIAWQENQAEFEERVSVKEKVSA